MSRRTEPRGSELLLLLATLTVTVEVAWSEGGRREGAREAIYIYIYRR